MSLFCSAHCIVYGHDLCGCWTRNFFVEQTQPADDHGAALTTSLHKPTWPALLRHTAPRAASWPASHPACCRTSLLCSINQVRSAGGVQPHVKHTYARTLTLTHAHTHTHAHSLSPSCSISRPSPGPLASPPPRQKHPQQRQRRRRRRRRRLPRGASGSRRESACHNPNY